MRLEEFKLERYLARYEFSARYLLCCSDLDGWSMASLLALADQECQDLWNRLKLGYTESRGHPLLRQQIASLYRGLDADHILTFAGAEEAIFAAFQVLLQPGDQALVTWPGYQSLHEVARAAGARVERLELRSQTGWALEEVAPRLGPDTRLVVVNFPHNPTGATISAKRMEELLDLGVRVFSDEVYRGLEYDPADRLPAAVELSDTALSLGVMSKAYGLAGLRVGWLACRDRCLLDRIAAFKDYTTICNSAPSEVLALIALRNQGTLIERSQAVIQANLAWLDPFMARYAARLQWVRPRAGCIAFPRLLDARAVAQFTEELLHSQDTLLLPGGVYDHPGNHFRIGFGRTNFPEGLERLGRFLG